MGLTQEIEEIERIEREIVSRIRSLSESLSKASREGVELTRQIGKALGELRHDDSVRQKSQRKAWQRTRRFWE